MIDWSASPAVESIPSKHGDDWLFTGTRLDVDFPAFRLSLNFALPLGLR